LSQLEHIEAIEKRLWAAADSLRANSNYASNEYFMPVMGLIFLRHAYSRFLKVRDEVVKTLPSRGGVVRALTKEDFSQKGAIFLQPKAQFDSLVALTDSDDRIQAVIDAMESIESDYETLRDQLPKQEYRDLDNEELGKLLRALNPEELKTVSGDIFGRIYEYFLTGFAGQKAHDGGEFFTPVSLVELIVNFIEPKNGKVLDPACGSGGMFVQSAHFVEKLHKNPSQTLTFYGMEKNPTTVRLGKMNLAVHGLEGDIQKAISYYDDPHQGLFGNASYVMANPPFNVDEVDGDKAKADTRRLPFGVPGINKAGKVSNGNYLWISYFYSYLNPLGRAGFVMSSQASSAGGEERKVRERLIKTGHVDAMVDIRGNFFYTRTVPCQLWFLDRGKSADRSDTVLMIDARNVFRQVNRTICDFSPEQTKNLTAIMWLYRGQTDRYAKLLEEYAQTVLDKAKAVTGSATRKEFETKLDEALDAMAPFWKTLPAGDAKTAFQGLQQDRVKLSKDLDAFKTKSDKANGKVVATKVAALTNAFETDLHELAEHSRTLVHEIDALVRGLTRWAELAEKELGARDSDVWNAGVLRGRTSLLKALESLREELVESLKLVRYFQKSGHWLTSRFPEGRLVDVPGLVKAVTRDELEKADWSLTPGRYVGVAPPEVDEDFDFEEAMRALHTELAGLDQEAQELSKTIQKNFAELLG
jgi:type I restriction enzyme M protein